MTDADPAAIRAAVNILRNGGLVAFATETVYGLGADATNPEAIRRVYQAKGRPPTNPLIVHVIDEAMAMRYTTHWPVAAQILARAFWPGPLTLVVPRGPSIAPQVSADLDTIGVRSPNHALAQSLLRAFDGPIAAPSANRSNRISPTTAEHVRAELGDAVDLILDGGACQVGIESTVVDVSSTRPAILRPGSITAAQIADLIGDIETGERRSEFSQPAASPGQHLVHYAPRTPAFRFTSAQADRVIRRCQEETCSVAIVLLERQMGDTIVAALPPGTPGEGQGGGQTAESRSTGIQHPQTTRPPPQPSPGVPGEGERSRRVVIMPRDPQQYAQRLYAILHELDAGGFTAIWIELPQDEPAWAAVRDRILRATNDYLPG